MNIYDQKYWSPPPFPGPQCSMRPPNGVHLVTAASIPPEPIQWLWEGWVAEGEINIVCGPPGTGKTTFATNIAAIISNGGYGGRCWPDKSPAPLRNVIYWSGEDGIENTVIPRMHVAGANLNRIKILRGTHENGNRRPFDFSKDLPKLSQAMAEIGELGLVIIDSIVQAVPGDSNKNADVRRALEPLVALAKQHRCAILGVTHVNKSSKGKEPLDRVSGSLAYAAVARVVMLTVKVQSDPTDETPPGCVLVRAKSNLGPDDGGFAYQIQSAEFQASAGIIRSSTIRWSDTPLQGTAKNILMRAEAGGESETCGAVDAAKILLRKILANGGLPFPDVETRAQEEGVSMAAIKRAKSALGIKSEKQCGAGQASPHIWYLPVTSNNQIIATGFDNFSSSFASINPQNQIQPQYPFQYPSEFPVQGPFLRPVPFSAQGQFPQQNERPILGEMTASFSPVEPVALHEPVEPVEPVEPPSKSILSQEHMALCINRVCELSQTRKPDLDQNFWSYLDDIIDDVPKEVFGPCIEDDEPLQLEIKKALLQHDWNRELHFNLHPSSAYRSSSGI